VLIAKRLAISGKVQGVFYRDWTVKNAREFGLAGWVRNEADGTVSALLEGEEPTVRMMIDQLHRGPPAARVASVAEEDAMLEGLASFDRR